MKSLLPFFLVVLAACSNEDEPWNYIYVDLKEPEQALPAGSSYQLIANITTPNTLRAITIFIGNQEVNINSFNSPREHIIDTTFRTEPTRTSIVVRVRAEDNVGNFEDKITVNFEAFQLPEACVKANSVTIVAAIPNTTPAEEDVYIHGGFNNNLLADSNYKLVPIPGTSKCSCLSLPSQNATIQFNRGTEGSINQTYNCNDALFGVSASSTSPLAMLLDKWKDIDCVN